MCKNLTKIIAVTFLLFTSNGYAMSECSGVGPYSWDNCIGSSNLVNGMSWQGEYQSGGPNGKGTFSANFGEIEGVITSLFGIVTGISGTAYGLHKGKKIKFMEVEDLVMDEITASGLVAKGTFYFPEYKINGYMVEMEGYQKYVGKLTQVDGQSGYVATTSKVINVISELMYQNLEKQYSEEIFNFRKARNAELTKRYSKADRKNSNYQKNHAKELAKRRASRVYYLRNGNKNKASPYLFDSFIRKVQAI